jgi:hypothetical protein
MSFLLIGFGDLLGAFVIIPQKLEIFLILKAILDMKGERQEIKHILAHFFIVVGHCIEEGFLISEDVVVDQMVMHFALLDLGGFDELSVLEVS